MAGSLAGLGVQPDQLQEAVSTIDPAKVADLIGTVLAGLSARLSSLVFLSA